MEATQLVSDSILESDEEENEEEDENKRERPFAKLCILKNEHVPETTFPLVLGDNVLGRDPSTCTLPLSAPSVSKQHATICISAYARRGSSSEVDVEALVWDLGSMNGTRKGRLKLTPNVRYALSDGDSLLMADIPCQYVSCTVASTQREPSTPVNRNSDVKAKLPGTLGKKEGDKGTGSKKCVNGSTKARVSTSKTPVRSCLSFEQTPTQPHGTLVPESDSDSDGERGGAGDRRRKALMSDSDSHKSSPTCSTFLSPTNKIVPESEDESPITPSSSTKNRPHRHVSFSKETEVDVGGQLLEEKKAHVTVHDSEEEEGAAPEGKVDEKSGQHVPVRQESSASPVGEDELPVCTAAEAIPAFNMDSDTDMEEEEEGVVSVGPLTLNTNQVNEPQNTIQFHMDSDTDVDEDEGTIDKTEAVPSSEDNTRPPHVNSVIQPEEFTVDSDTDVEEDEVRIDKAPEAVASSDDNTKPPHVNSVIHPEGVAVNSDTDVQEDAAVSDAVTKAKPMSCQTAQIADTASLMQPSDFHLDSDTDVDEEEDNGCKTNKSSSKIDETPPRLDIKPTEPDSALTLESDTDDEVIPAPALSEPVVLSAATESCTAANRGDDSLCDSDTDVDDDAPVVIPVAATTSPGTKSEALESVSNTDTDLDGSIIPPANPPDLGGGSDTDMEDKKAGEGQIPNLYKEKMPGLLVHPLQNCSTPVQSSEEVEGMETQAFLSPSSVQYSAIAPVVGSVVLSSCSESQDEDYIVAETQSFILQTRHDQVNPPGDHTMALTQAFSLEPSDDDNDKRSTSARSFQLGLSDSSHLECQDQALAMESTQAFVSADRSVNMDRTQGYADRTSAENDLNLVATQLYGKNEEPARCSAMSEKASPIDLAQEATQVYISECHSDSENETDEDETKNMTAEAETQPLGFPTSHTLAMAETQPLSAFEGEETLATDKPVSIVQQASPINQNETEEREDNEEAAQRQQKPSVELLYTAETQPKRLTYSTCDDEESNQEDSIPGPQKRKAKPLQLGEDQKRPCISSDLSIFDTQPMATSENEESENGDLIPIFQRRSKPMQNEEEMQPVSSSEVSVAETQPMGALESEQSDEEDLIQVQQNRKAKRLQLEEEQTQPVTIQTQPIVTGEDEESSDEDMIQGLLSAVRTQTGVQLERESGRQFEAGNSGVSARNKRGTKGKNNALTTTSGRRGKSRPSEDDGEEEEEVEHARRARGKKFMEQQKLYEKEREWCETEGNGHAGNIRLIKEKQEGGLTSATSPCSSRHHKSGIIEKEKGEGEREHRSEEQERLDMERKEKEEQASLQAENTERIRLEQEKADKERKECEEKGRLEHERAEREKERKEQEERERLDKEKRELEETLEGKKKEQEEKERSDRLQKEKEQQLENERLEHEKAEQEKFERKEKERIEKERMDQEEKKRLEKEKREIEERLEREKKEEENQVRLQKEANEREEAERLVREKETKEKQIKEHQENKEVNNPKVPTRGRKGARRTTTAACRAEAEQDSTISTNDDDVPARRTRSRSNSSNSVSSERSASSVTTQEAWGRGQGRGNKRTSEPPQATITRNSRRRTTVAAETTQHNSKELSPHGVLSRCNSSNSLNSEISNFSMSSQNRGRGSRQRGRQRKSDHEPVSMPCINNQSDQNSAPKPAARGRKSRKTEESSHMAPQDEGKAESQQPCTTRGQHRVNANVSEPTAADEEDQPSQEEGVAREESPLLKRNVRGRGQKAQKREILEAPVAPAVSERDETKDKTKGRKRDLEAKIKDDSSSGSKIWKGNEKTQTTEEEGKDDAEEESPVQVKRGGRASVARAKRNAKESLPEVEVKDESEKMDDIVEKEVRGQPSAVQKKKKKEQQAESRKRDEAKVEALEPQTPTTTVSRKRQAPANSSPVAKSPRSSSASPAARGRQQAASQGYKVLFTGLVDEAGERVLACLRGSIAKGVADMNCLVTDKVRRTVKFLCAVAKGIPIVTTLWLEKSGKAGLFLSPNAYVVKDAEQEKKFGFSLKESLRIASCQPLLQGYEIHVTKSVRPEPAQMKDIISCSGATFLPKMPSSPKPQTVVISCEEDWSLCGPAVSASLPVVTAEFILTGILQQKVDIQTHSLSAPVTTVQLAGGRGRGRKKT